jgi:hypothetical protein
MHRIFFSWGIWLELLMNAKAENAAGRRFGKEQLAGNLRKLAGAAL